MNLAKGSAHEINFDPIFNKRLTSPRPCLQVACWGSARRGRPRGPAGASRYSSQLSENKSQTQLSNSAVYYGEKRT